MLRYTILVTGPAYGTQHATSAWQFANAVINAGHQLTSIFFYREGVFNASQLNAPASDEHHLSKAWASLSASHGVSLNICVAAALRRGVTDREQADILNLPGHNLHPAFSLSGLGALAQAALTCDRLVQF